MPAVYWASWKDINNPKKSNQASRKSIKAMDV